MRGTLAPWVLPLASLLGCGGTEPDPTAVGKGAPVVLIVIDTLRADHLSCYGYELETSPVLDEFARRAYVFERNTTQCNSTFPSLTSILTGLYVKSHRNYLPVPVMGQTSSSKGAENLSQRFAAAGYYCIAAISHPGFSDINKDLVLFEGWDALSFIGPPIPVAERPLYARAEYTNERIFPLLEEYERASDKPLFLWAHYFDPHTDLEPWVYNAPPETRNLFLEHHLTQVGQPQYFEDLARLEPKDRAAWINQNIPTSIVRRDVTLANGRALYDAEIRSCDAGIEKLLDRLDEMGILEEAVVIVMADHGENLEGPRPGIGQLAFNHKRLYQPVSHTPLIIKLPGQVSGARIDALTQNIDVAPTLMQLFDLVATPAVEGRSLVPLLASEAQDIHPHVFMESSDQIEKSVRTRDLKYIDRAEFGQPQVFDLRSDPGEVRDLGGELASDRLAPFARAMATFRPVFTLRLRITPADEPFTVSIELETPRSAIDRVVGVSASTLSEDRHHFRWTGTVEDKQVDVVLFLRRQDTEMWWRITHDGAADMGETVYLGEHPIERTTALPIWTPSGQPAPDDPDLILSRDRAARTLSVVLPEGGDEGVEVEWRYRAPSYEKSLELVASEGFTPLEERAARVFHSSAPGGRPLSATLSHSPEDEDVLALVRIDSRWPDARRVVLDGGGVRSDVLEFLFPFPVDGRITSYLMTDHEADRAPPGSIALWIEAGGAGAEIDTSGLDPELVEQLRAIGYLGDDDQDE